ncbi:glucose/arabinose dehydrogenase [Paenibacillus castaneae]|uniref:PQQ-dependent sugar dehydrogenase n=1 Tax=Paenibacillus castaneae TaxID=474957 RepID=UPI001FB8AC09|nr:PQQ-dependent sugar dehydrogenase [Paenibacillus castaneae]NIK77932.1 glucose/arabinose dehydrogenase [Paenibacillus castaneae]
MKINTKRIAIVTMISVGLSVIGACERNEPSRKVISTNVSSTIAPEHAATNSNLPYTVLAKELRVPWVIAFDRDDIYISEREGSIVKVSGVVMTRQPVNLHKNVQAKGEGGFLGFLLAPDFQQSRRAYAYHSYEEAGEIRNRVVLLEQNGGQWNEVNALLEGIPGAANHDGGRLAFGPDKLLYVTTGDAQQGELAQDLNSLAGKILRITLNGKVPEDNPFPNSYIYSYGHRNPQGLAWNEEGVMFNTEHGPSGNPGGHDEINIIEAGENYGWPDIYGDGQHDGMITPIYHTGDPAIAPSGMTIDSNNRLLIATLAGGALYRYDPAAKTMESIFEGEGRLRDVKIKEGKIFIITNNTDGRGIPSKMDDRLLMLN